MNPHGGAPPGLHAYTAVVWLLICGLYFFQSGRLGCGGVDFFCGCTISGGFVRLSAMASLECKHPTCSGKTCRRPKKEKKRYYIPRVSVKRKSELEQYKEARISFLKGKVCEICGKKATEVHHKKGRGVLLNAIEYWMAICRKCHIGITEHSKEAIEKGYSIKRNV